MKNWEAKFDEKFVNPRYTDDFGDSITAPQVKSFIRELVATERQKAINEWADEYGTANNSI